MDVNTVFLLSPESIYLEASKIPLGIAVIILGLYLIIRLKCRMNSPIQPINSSDTNQVADSTIKKYSSALLGLFSLIIFSYSYHAYQLASTEIDNLERNWATSSTVAGQFKNLHNYDEDWDYVSFEINELKFDYRIENLNLFDFDRNQKELEQYENKTVEIVYSNDMRILKFSYIR
ncbi:hypothetical protein ACOJR9_02705 [Alteromonas sp. A081]|uniref:hypothetical protein n=1 Tax=Alteromonas sp. A081 TaxID=3410269 RepID=UPI003B97D811